MESIIIDQSKPIKKCLKPCTYWSEFKSWLHEEGMEFPIEPLTIALNKLKSAFDVEKLGIELTNYHDKLQVLTLI